MSTESYETTRDRKKADGEGFEPPVPCGTPVFKTGAFDHSATRPAVGGREQGIVAHQWVEAQVVIGRRSLQQW